MTKKGKDGEDDENGDGGWVQAGKVGKARPRGGGGQAAGLGVGGSHAEGRAKDWRLTRADTPRAQRQRRRTRSQKSDTRLQKYRRPLSRPRRAPHHCLASSGEVLVSARRRLGRLQATMSCGAAQFLSCANVISAPRG